ncbi:MAG: tRNA pseudouridine(55) synthase TruB [Candidatus Latescibacteria bacterium]|nr:tRNA pseudouridine(55) synthase TruB [Candidatus Latescibacterota bacterium]
MTNMDGVLAVDKPSGMTSHDVVAAVRRGIGGVKVGHTGTLDPMATGLLFLCIGRATKSAKLLEAHVKEYEVEVHLGVSTTTGDAEGEILERCEVPFPETEHVIRVCQGFTGEVEQIPPMFSAVKVEGQRLYRLARRGLIVERPLRKVTISTIEVLDYTPPFLRLRIVCSKGTYIRTLVEDLAAALGLGAYVRALRRSKIGRFLVEQALPLDLVLRMASERRIVEHLLTVDELQDTGDEEQEHPWR